jgi:CRP-like cAMP-binding protein
MSFMNLDKIAALRRTELFKALDDETLAVVADCAVARRFQKDEVLFIGGEEALGLYVIVEGSVRAFRESLDGREQVIHIERTGGTVGEVPVFDGGTYPSTVATEEDTTTLFLDKRDVRQLFVEHPEISLAALTVLAARLRRCAELVEVLSLKEVSQRVARFLLSEAKRSGTQSESGLTIELKQTNQQIAASVGSVREVVSRAFSRLQQENLIVLHHRTLTIPNESALAAFANQS